MSSLLCTFCCSNEVSSNQFARVTEMVFVLDSKTIQFTEILDDVLTLLKPIDANSQICRNCVQAVFTFYKFKQNVPESLIFASNFQQQLMRATSDFFEKTTEEIFTMEHLSCFSFVPASKVDLMKNFNPMKNPTSTSFSTSSSSSPASPTLSFLATSSAPFASSTSSVARVRPSSKLAGPSAADNIGVHERSCGKILPNSFKCFQCNKAYKAKQGLKKHIEKKHEA